MLTHTHTHKNKTYKQTHTYIHIHTHTQKKNPTKTPKHTHNTYTHTHTHNNKNKTKNTHTTHIVREETSCHQLAVRVLLYASSHRQNNTYHSLCYTSCGALAGMRNSSRGPQWRIDPTTHRTMSGATSRSHMHKCITHYF